MEVGISYYTFNEEAEINISRLQCDDTDGPRGSGGDVAVFL